MQEDLQQAFAVIIRWEGGWTEFEAEPGGASNWGISMVTFADWRKKHKLAPPTKDDLKALTSDQAVAIYEENWAPIINFNALPVGVDLRMLDISVNLGVTGGIKLLQQELGVNQTGRMDGITMLALRSFSAPDRAASLCTQLGAAWILLKKQAPNWDKYQKGWMNRSISVTNSCLDMINAQIANTANTSNTAQGNT